MSNELQRASGGGDLTQMGGGQQRGGVMATTGSNRKAAEVQAAMVVAQQFPRDQISAMRRITDSCMRVGLAETAVYSYPKGGTRVTGASIRMAEMLAQNWGNIDFGVNELEQANGASVIEAYCWDLETNTRVSKVFTVPHVRSKRSGDVKLTDPRDIYEMVANQGARRLRACILAVIPGDVQDAAMEACNKTLSGQNNGMPLVERIKNASTRLFAEYNVTTEQIEEMFGCNLGSLSEQNVIKLGQVYTSLRDGMSTVDNWFGKEEPDAGFEGGRTATKKKVAKKIVKKAVKKPAVVEADSKAMEQAGPDEEMPPLPAAPAEADTVATMKDYNKFLDEVRVKMSSRKMPCEITDVMALYEQSIGEGWKPTGKTLQDLAELLGMVDACLTSMDASELF